MHLRTKNSHCRSGTVVVREPKVETERDRLARDYRKHEMHRNIARRESGRLQKKSQRAVVGSQSRPEKEGWRRLKKGVAFL
jgi:hypothetical protein